MKNENTVYLYEDHLGNEPEDNEAFCREVISYLQNEGWNIEYGNTAWGWDNVLTPDLKAELEDAIDIACQQCV